MCPKSKHLKHLIFEGWVGDLGLEGFVVEIFFGNMVCLEKLEGQF